MSAKLKQREYVGTYEAAVILNTSPSRVTQARENAAGLFIQCRGGLLWNVRDMDAVADLREVVNLTLPAAFRVYSALKSGELDEFIAQHYVT